MQNPDYQKVIDAFQKRMVDLEAAFVAKQPEGYEATSLESRFSAFRSAVMAELVTLHLAWANAGNLPELTVEVSGS